MRILNAWRNAEYVGSFYYSDGKYGFQYDSSVKVPQRKSGIKSCLK